MKDASELGGTIRTLYDAIVEHVGGKEGDAQENMLGAAEHGADAGWGGFVNYGDTVAFHDSNENAIWELLGEEADSQGLGSALELITSFKDASNVGNMDQLKNLLAWFALEQVGHALEDCSDAEESENPRRVTGQFTRRRR